MTLFTTRTLLVPLFFVHLHSLAQDTPPPPAETPAAPAGAASAPAAPAPSPAELVDKFKSFLGSTIDAVRQNQPPAGSTGPAPVTGAEGGEAPVIADPAQAPSPGEVVDRFKNLFGGQPEPRRFSSRAVPNEAPVFGAARINDDVVRELDAIKTTDAAETQKRWGAWSSLVGTPWMYTWGPDKNRHVVLDLQWKVPGALAAVNIVSCEGGQCKYRKGFAVAHPEASRVSFGNLRGLARFDMLWDDGREDLGEVQPTGEVLVGSAQSRSAYRYDAARQVAVVAGQEARRPTREDMAALAKLNVTLSAGTAQSMLAEMDRAQAKADAEAAAARAAAEAQARAEAKARAEAEKRAAAQAAAEAKLQAAAEAKRKREEEQRQRQLAALVKRWGAFAEAADKGPVWLGTSTATAWTEVEWVKPGQAMRVTTGHCRRGECSTIDYDVRAGKPGQIELASRDGSHRLAGKLEAGGAIALEELPKSSPRSIEHRFTGYRFQDGGLQVAGGMFSDPLLQKPSTPDEVLNAPHTVAAVRRQEEARRLAEQRAREEEERRIAAAERAREERAEREQERINQARMFQSFTNTLASELAAGQAQRQQQQQYLNNLQAQARAQQEARQAQQEREARAAAQARQEARDRDARAYAQAREEAMQRDQRANSRAREEAAERDRAGARARDEARAREEARARDEARAREQARARDEARAREERAREEAKAREEARAREEAKAREAREQARAREEARAKEERARDEARKVAAASRGPARAWCMQKPGGEYRCNGPLQNGGWGKTLKAALSMVDCPDGHGYSPKPHMGGQSFNCGRPLRPDEQVMPTYDPFFDQDKLLR